MYFFINDFYFLYGILDKNIYWDINIVLSASGLIFGNRAACYINKKFKSYKKQ